MVTGKLSGMRRSGRYEISGQGLAGVVFPPPRGTARAGWVLGVSLRNLAFPLGGFARRKVGYLERTEDLVVTVEWSCRAWAGWVERWVHCGLL
jgi:hypothetical protein